MNDLNLITDGIQNRILGWDFLRVFCLWIISLHHLSWAFAYDSSNLNLLSGLRWFVPLEWFMRVFAFSGYVLFFMSLFLIANKGLKIFQLLKLSGFLILAWVIFSASFRSDEPYFLAWDVYPLIVLSLWTAWCAQKIRPSILYALGFIGVGFLFIPFWKMEIFQRTPLFFQQVLIGNCSEDLADWPIFPWIGLAWMAFALGACYKNKKIEASHSYFKIKPRELFVWMPVLSASVPGLGSFLFLPQEGETLDCALFRQPPLSFICHLVWIVFILRLLLDERIQTYLSRTWFPRWLSSLRLSREFGLAYLVHYPLCIQLGLSLRKIAPSYPLFTFFAFFIPLPLTELMIRFFNSASLKLKNLCLVILFSTLLFPSCESKKHQSLDESQSIPDTPLAVQNQARLEFIEYPSNVEADKPFTVSVRVLIENGTPDRNFKKPIIISIASHPPDASYFFSTGPNMMTPENGTVNFTNLRISKPGNQYTLSAQSGETRIFGRTFTVLPESAKAVSMQIDQKKIVVRYVPPDTYIVDDEERYEHVPKGQSEVIINSIKYQVFRLGNDNLIVKTLGPIPPPKNP